MHPVITPDGKRFELPKPPPVHAFPEHPASWYLFAHLDALRKGPLTKMILGRRLVAFRTESGRFRLLTSAPAMKNARPHPNPLPQERGRGQRGGSDDSYLPRLERCWTWPTSQNISMTTIALPLLGERVGVRADQPTELGHE